MVYPKWYLLGRNLYFLDFCEFGKAHLAVSVPVVHRDITFNSLYEAGAIGVETIEFDVSSYDRVGDGKVSFAEFKEIEEG